MKKIFSFLLSLLIALSMQASHFGGAGMRYECLGGCVYRVYHTNYLDCSGAGAVSYVQPLTASNPYPGPVGVLATGNTGCTVTALGTSWTLYNWQDITPACPSSGTQCNVAGALIGGLAEATYYRDYDICNSACTSVNFSWSSCCRNYSITSGASANNMYLDFTINLAAATCNNSPEFVSPPLSYIQGGQMIQIPQTAIDIDGDSLSYSIVACKQTSTTNVTYSPGYSPSSPLGPTWMVQINNHTGLVTFTPNTTGALVVGVMGVKVEEFRNGVSLGAITRDMQINVFNSASAANTAPAYTISNISGGFISGANTLDAFDNIPFGFDIQATDANAGQLLSFAHNLASQFPTATITGLTNTNPMQLHFAWTPATINVGTSKPLFVDIFDDNCPINGHATCQYNIKTAATPSSPIINLNTMPLTGGQYTFNASVSGGNAPFTYSWYATGNPTVVSGGTGNNITLFWATAGFYQVCLDITDANGITYTNCTNVTANPPNPPTVSLTTTNQGNGQYATLATISGGTAPYSYSWYATGNPTVVSGGNPYTVYWTTPGSYQVCITVTDANGMTANTCNNITYTTCSASFTANSTSSCCAPFTVQFVYTGNSAPPTTYNWSFGDGSNSTVANPSHTYVVSGIFNACLMIDNGAGCLDTACTTINVGTGVDLDGYIYTNSSAADSFLVYMIKYDTTGGGTLTAIDSQYVFGSPAYYNFSNIQPDIYYTKAAILAGSANYANYIPTYHDSTLFWASATPINFLSMPPLAPAGDIYMVAGVNPGGPGFIGGLLSQGANKTLQGASAGREIILFDNANNQPVAYTYTDVNGMFSFNNIAYGTYKIYPEIINKLTIPRMVTLSATATSVIDANMIIQHDSVYPDNTVPIIAPSKAFDYIGNVQPNPTKDKCSVNIALAQNAEINFSLVSVTGQVVWKQSSLFSAGVHSQEIDLQGLSSGMYFLTIGEGRGAKSVQKIVKE